MILVTGATGKIGREVVPQLLDRGLAVRALTRNPAKARIDPRAEVVGGDLDLPDSFPALLDGVDQVFVLTAGHSADGAEQERRIAEAATRSGAAQLVKLSTTGVHFGQTDRISLVHTESEAFIRQAGPLWTILRPGAFMANRFAWLGSIRDEGTVYLTEGDPDSALIHPRDIAAVAATVLADPDTHAGATYPLSGGEALTSRRQVEILGEELGRELVCVEESEDATRARFAGYGWPTSSLDGLFELKRQSADNERVVFDTVERLLGRGPLTFADWARENAAAFG